MNKKLNHNMKFMFGIMALALVVLAVVVVFWLWCFPQGVSQQSGRYQILLEDGFAEDSLQVMLDDSVLFDGLVPFEPYALEVDYPEREAVLLVGDYASGDMAVFDMRAGEKPLKLKKDDESAVQVCE